MDGVVGNGVESRPPSPVYPMRVLFVEDSARLRYSVGQALRHSGYAVDLASDGEEGLWQASTLDFDVIILDLMLPKLDGLAVLERLRSQGKRTHVLLLTARDAVNDRVRGLNAGADDYLIKPFALEELLARVEALCRRGYGHKSNRLQVGDLEIDTSAKQAVRAGHAIHLKPREFQLLEYLARRTGEVATQSEIEAHLYNEEAEPMSNVVESTVSSIRRKIHLPGMPHLIHTRRGMGYVLEVRTP